MFSSGQPLIITFFRVEAAPMMTPLVFVQPSTRPKCVELWHIVRSHGGATSQLGKKYIIMLCHVEKRPVFDTIKKLCGNGTVGS